MARRVRNPRRSITATSLYLAATCKGVHMPRPPLARGTPHRAALAGVPPRPAGADRVAVLGPAACSAAMPPADGYLRMTWHCLCDAEFAHLFSGMDAEPVAQPTDSLTAICGYTEWVSCEEPVISLGWDWWLNSETGLLELAGRSLRSNLMLVGHDRADLGCHATEHLLGERLAALEWQPAVACAVGLRQ